MCKRRRWSTCSVIGVALSVLGCSPLQQPMVVPDAADTGEQPDAGSQPDAPPVATVPTLPLTISDYFIPGGYMGDGEISPTAVVVATTACKQPRPGGVTGDCYRITYTPTSKGWAGVYWQYPLRNWGTMPGKQVEVGATRVTFYAAAETGGQLVDFIAGENDPKLPYHDSVTAKITVQLTTALTQYQIDISGQAYDSGVLGAFAWSLAAPLGSSSPITLYLDSLRWEK